MRCFAILAATAAATVSAQAPCNATLLTPLLADPNVQLCTADSGLSLPPAPGSISADMLAKACASTGCKSLVEKLVSLNLGDCSVGTFKIDTDLIKPLSKACGSAENSNSTGTNSTSNSNGTNNIENPSTTTPTVPSPTPTTKNGASAVTYTVAAAIVTVATMALW